MLTWDLRIQGPICSKNDLIGPESCHQPSAIKTNNTNILLVNYEHSNINIFIKFPSFPSTPTSTTHMHMLLILFIIIWCWAIQDIYHFQANSGVISIFNDQWFHLNCTFRRTIEVGGLFLIQRSRFIVQKDGSVHKAYKDLLGVDSKFASDRASNLIGKIIAGEDNISRDTLTNSKTMLLQSESFNLDDNKTSTYSEL